MSLQLIAKQMEAKGRNGDSVLVHMTTGEVAGLQKLAESAGGSLSVNPETGLVEANFLKQVMPALVSGALMASGIGMPLAIAGGALTGGIQARRNNQDFLTGALMGGISGYGGATLAGGLSAAGAAAGTGIGAGAAGSTPTMAQSLAQTGQGIGALGKEAGQKAFMESVGGGRGLLRAGMSTLASAANEPVAQPQSPYPQMSMDINRSVAPFQDIQAYQAPMPSYSGGAGNVYIPTFRAAEGGSVGGNSGGSDMVFGGLPNDDVSRTMLEKFPTMQKLIGQLSPATLARLGVAQQEEVAPAPAPRRSAPELRAYEPEMPQYTFENGTYIPTFRAAEGGLASLAKGGMKEGGFVVPADVVSMVGEGNTDAGYRRIMEALPGSSPIKGQDGGQADTVKTNIEGKQPAAVAHGEVYVPPEAVKKAGGAKKLYAMMDRVREQATGSKKQIKPVRLESAMA